MTILCRECNKDFHKKVKQQVFCSRVCKNTHNNREKPKRIYVPKKSESYFHPLLDPLLRRPWKADTTADIENTPSLPSEVGAAVARRARVLAILPPTPINEQT